MEHFNFETKELTLVTDTKKDKLETKTYTYPIFVNGLYLKQAINLGSEFEQNEGLVPSDLFNKFTKFIVELYEKQFTEKELLKGLSAEKTIETFTSIIMSVLAGDEKNE